MSVTIRLARTGKRNAPSYRIVAANTRDKRNGRPLDVLGYYNPSLGQNAASKVSTAGNNTSLRLDQEKLGLWKGRGALITDAVKKLIGGTYVYTKYQPNKKVEEKVEKPDEEEAQ